MDAYFRLPWLDFLFFRHDNEHLPWLAMPFYAADIGLFGAHGNFLIAVLLCLNAGLAISITMLARSLWGEGKARPLTILAASFASFFWLLHTDNLVWPKQIHMYLSLLAFLGACHTLIWIDHQLHNGRPPARSLVLLVLLLLASTFSFAYGIIGWLAVLLVMIGRRWPWRLVVGFVAFFISVIIFYSAVYAPHPLPSTHTRPLEALGRPVDLFWYNLHYLGNPVQRLLFRDENLGLATTVAALVLALYALVSALRGRQSIHAMIGIAIMAFAMGTSFITSLSRVGLGPSQAETLRYGVVQIFFWLGFGLWVAPWLLARLADRPLVRAWIFPVIIALMLPFHFRMLSRLDRDVGRIWQGVLAVLNHADADPIVTDVIHPSVIIARRMTDGLVERRLALFAAPQPHWLGQPFDKLFETVPANRCEGDPGRLQTRPALVDKAYATGSAWDVTAHKPADWVITVDAGGTVVGLGRAVKPGAGRDRADWQAYTQLPDGNSDNLRVYAVLGDQRSACPLPPLIWGENK